MDGRADHARGRGAIINHKTNDMNTKVRTTPNEVAKYREIRAIIGDAENARDNAYNELRAAYEAENRPMTCNPANDVPEKVAAFFAPKLGAISTAEYRYMSALAKTD